MEPQIILGLGAGHCGLNVLADILNRQPKTRVTLEQIPLLPWEAVPGRPGIRERFERWRKAAEAPRVGDVATFYLPYLEEAIAAVPGLRAVCLQRPRDEIVSAYIRHLDQPGRPRLNHWSRHPAAGWTQDLVWTPTFPKYEIDDRNQALARYCEEYETASRALAARYPLNVRVVDTADLTRPETVRDLLDFVGVPREEQNIITVRPPTAHAPVESAAPFAAPAAMAPSRCVVLVPHSGMIHGECDSALRVLERRGYEVGRVSGYAAIDQGRNQIATDALRDGFEETLWIDSDIGFDPDAVEKLRAHDLPMVCGVYPQKGKRAIACHVLPGASRMTFGKAGGLVELLYAATGFLLVRRQVYLDVARKLALPVCNERFQHPMLPFFLPMIRPTEDGHWYLAEDYAFCERARQAGYRIFADTTIRLWHIGNYRYGWEDAGAEPGRFDSFTLNFPEGEGKDSRPT